MRKIKIGIFGAHGRMGQEINALVLASPQMEVFYALGSRDKLDQSKAKGVDVWIDFSAPAALPQVLKLAVANKTPVVCGTTGLDAKQKKMLQTASQNIPLLWSSNMSLGIAVLSEALKVFSSLRGFDFQVEEIHHIHKKDKPSGTAVTLQENLEKVVGKKLPPAIAIRGGGVFGVHKIFALSEEEVITFEHTALNRRVFAHGAVQAALWLKKQKPGFYTMKDCLFGGQ